MVLENNPPDDSMQIRCSKLGHQIHYSYCRKENFGLPCPRIIICWHPYFSVEENLRHELNEKEWKKVFEEPPKPKVLSLVELIEQAQKRKGKKL